MKLLEPEVTLQFQNRLKQFSFYLSCSVCVIGIMVLFGWQFDIEFIKRIIPGLVAMNPATAICFILAGITLTLINRNDGNKTTPIIQKVFAFLIILTGLSCLLTNVMEIKGGIDEWFFTDKLKNEVSNIYNRMAPNTAFNFIITGISLLLIKPEKGDNNRVPQYLILITALISLLSIIGYIYGVKSFYGVLTYIPMALHTSFCFLIISCAVLLVSCDSGFMGDFTNNYVGSVLARKLIPAIIVVPILLGFIIIYGEKVGLYVPHFGTALFTSVNILIFVYLIKKIQISVNEADVARTNAEKKLIEMNARLEESAESLKVLNTELESFSYSISHDLKAPLRTIKGFSKMLLEDYKEKLGPEGDIQINTIIDSAGKMSQLIDDLLEFSRIRRKEMQTSYCNMEMLAKNVLNEQSMTLKNKDYEIKIDNLHPCSGDPKMIEQVWVNLITNALKYSQKKEKPVIEIGSYKDNDEFIYFVKDNGDGFEMEYANKLFLVFQRLHSESEFEGTGIGLAIAHKIITRHGGKIWAEGKKNEGASFYFSLPVSQ